MRKILHKLIIVLAIILCVTSLFAINFPYGITVVVIEAPPVPNDKPQQLLVNNIEEKSKPFKQLLVALVADNIKEDPIESFGERHFGVSNNEEETPPKPLIPPLGERNQEEPDPVEPFGERYHSIKTIFRLKSDFLIDSYSPWKLFYNIILSLFVIVLFLLLLFAGNRKTKEQTIKTISSKEET